MKKRVRILVSLLMISGSLTVTSKSYAESYAESYVASEDALNEVDALNEIVSCMPVVGLAVAGMMTTAGILAYTMNRLKRIAKKEAIAANRFYKVGNAVFLELRKTAFPTKIGRNKITSNTSMLEGLAVGALVTGIACLGASISIASASEIIENPSLAMQNDEKFRLLVESVGVDPALELVGRIADGEDPERVMNTLASLLEQNSNTEKDSFLDSGHEEELGAQ